VAYRAVAYLSTAVAGLTLADIDHLLVDARAHNQVAGVTGVLLYDGHQFFQYFEGPEENAERIYERIRNSRMHVEINELHDYTLHRPRFHHWHMSCRNPHGSVLQKLCNTEWLHALEQLQEEVGQGSGTPALRDLLAFWERQVRVA
jgi:hypothetical protein